MEGAAVHGQPVLLAVILLSEYGVKQWVETNAVYYMFHKPRLAYAAFRLLNLAVHCTMALWLVGGHLRVLGHMIIISLLFLCELPLAALHNRLSRRLFPGFRWLQMLPMLAVIGWMASQHNSWLLTSRAMHVTTRVIDALPSPTTPDRFMLYFLGFAMLAYPANFLIRCFIGKEDDAFLAEAVLNAKAKSSPRLDLLEPQSAATWESPHSASAVPTPPGHGQTCGQSFPEYDFGGPPHVDTPLRAGRTIGILERWIVAGLAALDQMALIGLVLTAKSIARFKRFEQDPEFAEYYLLGTLSSIAIALLVGVYLKHA